MPSNELITIAVDAMGGDNAPAVVLDGVAAALQEDENLQVILVGPASVVEPFASSHNRCTAKVATETIGMGEHPAQAVRKKKDSSIVVGCKLVKEGQAQGFFSAGSTGACLAGATLVIGRIKGVSRPCLCSVIPSPVAPVVMADIGANADCKPEYLSQFAHMASIYAEKIVGIDKPTCALLNIGEEETKGSQFAQAAFAHMKENVPNFVGNCEGRDIIAANYDVVVTDGFTGNVVLKTIEGTSKTIFKTIKSLMLSTLATKLGALTLKGKFKDLAYSISPDKFGGAPLLGVKGACIVGHGSSNACAIKNGIHATSKVVRTDVCGLISKAVSR